MASPDILDFERLLAPISDEQPAGAELKEDPSLSAIYYQIKDAREAARSAERQLLQAAWGEEEERASIDPPDWRVVIDAAVNAIAEKSKDLWVIAWLVEGLVREHGFAGLRDGIRLARETSQQYWEGIHPRPDEDGYATTVAQLTGLNGEDSEGAIIAPIDGIPITDSATHGRLTSADYKQAVDLEQMVDAGKRSQRIEEGAVSMSAFDRAIDETTPEFFTNLLEDMNQCIEEFGGLCDVLEEKCGENEDGYSAAPPSSNIRNALQECRDRVRSISRSIIGGDEDEEASSDLVPVDAGGQGATGGKVQTRDDAFRALLQVADYFRRTEPHSPVSYALEQVVRWGRMSLPELLAELISDQSVRQEMFRRTGIPDPEASDSN